MTQNIRICRQGSHLLGRQVKSGENLSSRCRISNYFFVTKTRTYPQTWNKMYTSTLASNSTSFSTTFTLRVTWVYCLICSSCLQNYPTKQTKGSLGTEMCFLVDFGGVTGFQSINTTHPIANEMIEGVQEPSRTNMDTQGGDRHLVLVANGDWKWVRWGQGESMTI